MTTQAGPRTHGAGPSLTITVDGEEPIRIHERLTLVSVFTGETSVS